MGNGNTPRSSPPPPLNAAQIGGGSSTTGNTSLIGPPDWRKDPALVGVYNMFGPLADGLLGPPATSQGFIRDGRGSVRSGRQAQGDQTKVTAERVAGSLAMLAGQDPMRWAQIQQQMWRGGFYEGTGTKPPLFGTWDSARDSHAIDAWLHGAYQTGSPVDQFLNTAAQAGDSAGIHNGTFTPKSHVITETPTVTLVDIANKSFQTALGRDATPQESATFASTFQTQQIAAQNAVNAAQDQLDAQRAVDQGSPWAAPPASTTTVKQATTTADAAAQAEQAARLQNPHEAAAFDLGSQAQQVMKFLTQSSQSGMQGTGTQGHG